MGTENKVKIKQANRDFNQKMLCGKTCQQILDNRHEPCDGCPWLEECLQGYASPMPGKRWSNA